MASATTSAYGLASYIDAATQIAAREHVNQPLTLLRMLAAKAAFGLSATEYAQYGLQRKPFARLADYQTKKNLWVRPDMLRTYNKSDLRRMVEQPPEPGLKLVK